MSDAKIPKPLSAVLAAASTVALLPAFIVFIPVNMALGFNTERKSRSFASGFRNGVRKFFGSSKESEASTMPQQSVALTHPVSSKPTSTSRKSSLSAPPMQPSSAPSVNSAPAVSSPPVSSAPVSSASPRPLPRPPRPPRLPREEMPSAEALAPMYLMNAILMGDSQKTTQLLDQNKDLVNHLYQDVLDKEAIPQENMTPLHLAIMHGRNDIIAVLQQRGADLNAQDESGFTPLHYAVMSQNENAIKFLVSKGADLNNKDVNDRTPIELVDYLFDKKAMNQDAYDKIKNVLIAPLVSSVSRESKELSKAELQALVIEESHQDPLKEKFVRPSSRPSEKKSVKKDVSARPVEIPPDLPSLEPLKRRKKARTSASESLNVENPSVSSAAAEKKSKRPASVKFMRNSRSASVHASKVSSPSPQGQEKNTAPSKPKK